jgi:ribonuclease D
MVELVDGDLPSHWLGKALASPMVGMDIETSGLDREKDRIAMVQLFVPKHGTVMIRKLDSWPTNIATLLENKGTTKVFHYASFDLAFLIRDFPFVYPTKIADTKVAAAFFDPKMQYFVDKSGRGSHRLNVMVEKVFGYVMNKQISTSDWFADTLSPEQLTYAAKDVEYLPELLTFLERGIIQKDRGLIGPLMESYRYLPTKVLIDLKINRDVFAYR